MSKKTPTVYTAFLADRVRYSCSPKLHGRKNATQRFSFRAGVSYGSGCGFPICYVSCHSPGAMPLTCNILDADGAPLGDPGYHDDAFEAWEHLDEGDSFTKVLNWLVDGES